MAATTQKSPNIAIYGYQNTCYGFFEQPLDDSNQESRGKNYKN